MTEINGMRIFEPNEIEEICEIEKAEKGDYIGFFYVLEYSDSVVKIGSTRNPTKRINNLKSAAENYGNWEIGRYGRFAISKPHTNYKSNETILHKYFSRYRRSGGELFDLPFLHVVGNIPRFIRYEDESESMEEHSLAFLESMKKFILHDAGNECVKQDEAMQYPSVDLGQISQVLEITRKYILAAGGTPDDVLQAVIEIQWVFGIHNPVLDRRHKDFGGEQA